MHLTTCQASFTACFFRGVHRRQFPIRLLSSLVHMGIEPSRVILEITERAIEGSAEDIALNFAQLRSSGIRIALDDFGKSYSNLSSLRELRFDHLKVDGSFMRSALDPNRNVLHAVIALAKELSMPARAQGVESPELADMLADLGCEHAQGFHFGGVMDSVALDEFLSRSATEAKPRAA